MIHSKARFIFVSLPSGVLACHIVVFRTLPFPVSPHAEAPRRVVEEHKAVLFEASAAGQIDSRLTDAGSLEQQSKGAAGALRRMDDADAEMQL